MTPMRAPEGPGRTWDARDASVRVDCELHIALLRMLRHAAASSSYASPRQFSQPAPPGPEPHISSFPGGAPPATKGRPEGCADGGRPLVPSGMSPPPVPSRACEGLEVAC
eukprot:254031-Pyramimonas_sp.AAC.1